MTVEAGASLDAHATDKLANDSTVSEIFQFVVTFPVVEVCDIFVDGLRRTYTYTGTTGSAIPIEKLVS